MQKLFTKKIPQFLLCYWWENCYDEISKDHLMKVENQINYDYFMCLVNTKGSKMFSQVELFSQIKENYNSQPNSKLWFIA